MADIRSYIKDHLLEPLKEYPTVIQNTMIEVITEKLEELYEYSRKFPEIVTPHISRLNMLQAIADQFLFTVRDDADIQEQIDILENILYVYRIRGSIDSIENMWKYYGGNLPKEVEVIVPSYNLFRYNISSWSGTHSFLKGRSDDQLPGRIDMTANSPGIYQIKLTNNTYPIDKLKEFLSKELVAAGTEIYFTEYTDIGILSTDLDSNPYSYYINESNRRPYVYKNTKEHVQLEVLKSIGDESNRLERDYLNSITLDSAGGLTWSGREYHTLSNLENTGYDTVNAIKDNLLNGRYNLKESIYNSTWSDRDIRIELKLLEWLGVFYRLDPTDPESTLLYEPIKLNDYKTYESLGFDLHYTTTSKEIPKYDILWHDHHTKESSNSFVYCTPANSTFYIESDYYSKYGSEYPGYFVLGDTLLVGAEEEGDI